MRRNEDSIRDLWDNIKHTNILALQGSQKEKREKGPQKTFEEIIAENFPNMGKETVTQVQEVQRVPGKINPRRDTPRYTVMKLTKIKDKEKILKATNNIQGNSHKVIS